MTRHYYTEEEKAFVAANYATMSRAEIAEALGLPEMSVKLFIQRNKDIRKGRPKSAFQKGGVPWNAGIKGWVRKAGPSDFKPKQIPHNATNYHDGMVVTKKHKDGSQYRYRRLHRGKWVASHRYNWEQMNGPIPKGHCLKCCTSDTLNDEASNWQLVTISELAASTGIWGEHRASARLTPNYLAATLTKGRPELRKAVLANPQLLAAQEAKITLNRTIKHVLANPIG